MSSSAFFVTGTDTEVGKTYVSVRLLRALRAAGHTVLAMKPVAAGCEEQQGAWLNSDVEALRQAASFPVPRAVMNPYCFQPPISPHLAAEEAGEAIEPARLRQSLAKLQTQAELVLVEGAGGWYSPISRTQTMADLALELKLPVLLVVGLRLGCLNHALLTTEAIRRSGSPFLGWVANCVDPEMSRQEQNLEWLTQHLGQPLARVNYGVDRVEFDLSPLLTLARPV